MPVILCLLSVYPLLILHFWLEVCISCEGTSCRYPKQCHVQYQGNVVLSSYSSLVLFNPNFNPNPNPNSFSYKEWVRALPIPPPPPPQQTLLTEWQGWFCINSVCACSICSQFFGRGFLAKSGWVNFSTIQFSAVNKVQI